MQPGSSGSVERNWSAWLWSSWWGWSGWSGWWSLVVSMTMRKMRTMMMMLVLPGRSHLQVEVVHNCPHSKGLSSHPVFYQRENMMLLKMTMTMWKSRISDRWPGRSTVPWLDRGRERGCRRGNTERLIVVVISMLSRRMLLMSRMRGMLMLLILRMVMRMRVRIMLMLILRLSVQTLIADKGM